MRQEGWNWWAGAKVCTDCLCVACLWSSHASLFETHASTPTHAANGSWYGSARRPQIHQLGGFISEEENEGRTLRQRFKYMNEGESLPSHWRSWRGYWLRLQRKTIRWSHGRRCLLRAWGVRRCRSSEPHRRGQTLVPGRRTCLQVI